jgi:hypothetical protein
MAKATIRTHTTTVLELTEVEHDELQKCLEKLTTPESQNIAKILRALTSPEYAPMAKK